MEKKSFSVQFILPAKQSKNWQDTANRLQKSSVGYDQCCRQSKQSVGVGALSGSEGLWNRLNFKTIKLISPKLQIIRNFDKSVFMSKKETWYLAGSVSILVLLVHFIHKVALARRQQRDLSILKLSCPPVYHTRSRLHTVPFCCWTLSWDCCEYQFL